MIFQLPYRITRTGAIYVVNIIQVRLFYLLCCPRALRIIALSDLFDVMSSGKDPSKDRQFKSTYDKLCIKQNKPMSYLCLLAFIIYMPLDYQNCI